MFVFSERQTDIYFFTEGHVQYMKKMIQINCSYYQIRSNLTKGLNAGNSTRCKNVTSHFEERIALPESKQWVHKKHLQPLKTRGTLRKLQNEEAIITTPYISTRQWTVYTRRHTENYRTLLSGDYIINGISKRGMQNNFDVCTRPGNIAKSIYTQILNDDTSTY